MGAIDTIVAADHTTRGLPVDALLAEVRRPEVAEHRFDYPYIAGYASSALRSIGCGDDINATVRACAVALMLCKPATYRAIAAEAAVQGGDGMTYNPNWVAFAHALGHQPGDLNPGAGTNAMFMGWITRQAGDFTATTGITRETHPGDYADLFSAWLTNTWPAPTDATLARALHPAGSGR